jgi:glycosyltransferase involved in cell wall biosynthesis
LTEKAKNQSQIGVLKARKPISPKERFERLIATGMLRMKLNALRLTDEYRNRKQHLKVSIIMPTWNRGLVIGRAIESVLRQSYKNYELIVCDDGSTDGTERTLRSMSSEYGEIRYLRHKHSGVSYTRNRGLMCSTGDLIAYLDSDNVWHDNYLLLMVNTFVGNSDFSAGYCGIRITQRIGEKGCVMLRDYDRQALLQQNYIDLNVFIHYRSLFEELGGFDEGLISLEDWDLIIRYTKGSPPFVLKVCLATYSLEDDLEHLSSEKGLADNFRKIREEHGTLKS